MYRSGGREKLSNVEKKWWMCKLEQCIDKSDGTGDGSLMLSSV